MSAPGSMRVPGTVIVAHVLDSGNIDVTVYPSTAAAVGAMLNSGFLGDRVHGSAAHVDALLEVISKAARVLAGIAGGGL